MTTMMGEREEMQSEHARISSGEEGKGEWEKLKQGDHGLHWEYEIVWEGLKQLFDG